MRQTNINCPTCGEPMFDVGGFGEGQKLICNNTSCPSHYRHIKCQRCSSADKKVTVIGIGHQIFTCNNCGNQWSSI